MLGAKAILVHSNKGSTMRLKSYLLTPIGICNAELIAHNTAESQW